MFISLIPQGAADDFPLEGTCCRLLHFLFLFRHALLQAVDLGKSCLIAARCIALVHEGVHADPLRVVLGFCTFPETLRPLRSNLFHTGLRVVRRGERG